MYGFELDLATCQLDVIVLVIALDLDVMPRCAEDVFEDSES